MGVGFAVSITKVIEPKCITRCNADFGTAVINCGIEIYG